MLCLELREDDSRCMQTLTDKEYQRLRDASVAIIREMGVECGGSNVQMAVNPVDGEVVFCAIPSSSLSVKEKNFFFVMCPWKPVHSPAPFE